jgi:hypothetical protein
MIARAHRTESALIASGNYSSPGKTEPLAYKDMDQPRPAPMKPQLR